MITIHLSELNYLSIGDRRECHPVIMFVEIDNVFTGTTLDRGNVSHLMKQTYDFQRIRLIYAS